MSSQLDIVPTGITGLIELVAKPIKDRRGYFERLFCTDELSVVTDFEIRQINHSFTKKRGTVRGLHFQRPPFADKKIVYCIKGEVFDVVVDIRRNSATFMQWHGAVLSAEDHRAILIPEGFAHGFQTLTSDCELIYLHSTAYKQSAEGALNVADPQLDIQWPIDIEEISDRDQKHLMIDESFLGV